MFFNDPQFYFNMLFTFVFLSYALITIGTLIKSYACLTYDSPSDMFVLNVTDTTIYGLYVKERHIRVCSMNNDREVYYSQILNVCGNDNGCYDINQTYLNNGNLIIKIGYVLLVAFIMGLVITLLPKPIVKSNKIKNN